METLKDLQSQQIKVRCDIAELYGELLKLTPPSRKIVNAAHDWSLRNIEALVQDLLVNIPNHVPPKNPYSEPFLLSGINPQELQYVIQSLVERLSTHSQLSTRIEQVGKGVA